MINLSVARAERPVGIREGDDQVWQVSFLEYDLGYFDRVQDRGGTGPILRPGHGVNHVPGMRCKPCDWNTPPGNGSDSRIRTYDPLINSQLLYR
jgi:hypothetical protein